MQKPKASHQKKTKAIPNYCRKFGNVKNFKNQDTSQVFHTSTTGHMTEQPNYEEKREIHAMKNNVMHYEEHSMLSAPNVVNREFSL